MSKAPPADCQRAAEGAESAGARRWLRFLPLAVLLLAIAAVVVSGAWRWLSLDALRDRRAALQAYVRVHPILSLEVYAAAYAAVVALSLPGALIMSLSGGYLFGMWTGTAAALLGETVGAVAMYAAARTALGTRLAGGRGEGALAKMRRALCDNAVSSLLALRLMPGVPFGLVNLAAGLSRVPFGVYFVTTVVGIAPSTFVYCWIGQGLGRVFARNGAVRLSQLITPGVYAPVIGLALLALTPLAWKALHRRRTAAQSTAPS